jgi:hypothetical protein
MYCAVIVVLFFAGGPIQCHLATEIWCSSASGFFLLSIGAVIVGKHRKLKKVISVDALPTDCRLFTRLSTWCY